MLGAHFVLSILTVSNAWYQNCGHPNTYFRVIKESENVDERQHCFLMQTVGRESRYFSMETRQDLLRLESAWHRAVCQAVSSLRVINDSVFLVYKISESCKYAILYFLFFSLPNYLDLFHLALSQFTKWKNKDISKFYVSPDWEFIWTKKIRSCCMKKKLIRHIHIYIHRKGRKFKFLLKNFQKFLIQRRKFNHSYNGIKWHDSPIYEVK